MKHWAVAVVLAVCLAGSDAALAQATTTADGVYSIAQARRGAVHVQRCMTCHGDDLDGDLGPALVGPAFIARWAGRPLSDFLERVVANFESLARQGRVDDAGTVEQRSADFTAYLLLQNGFRSGSGEIRPSSAALREVLIVEPPRRR